MKTTDTALLGHVSRDALSAAALSDLWCCVAGDPNLAGIYLQVAYAVVSEVAVGVSISCNCT